MRQVTVAFINTCFSFFEKYELFKWIALCGSTEKQK